MGRLARGWSAAFACVALGVAAPAFADEPAISSPEAKAILEELRQIRALLERMQAAPAPAQHAPGAETPVTVKLHGGYVLGRLDAPVTMVEFTDYECPFCRQFHMASFEQLKSKYIDTGKLRYVSRDFPLDMHPHARAAAKMARCAGEQGRFWEMRRALIVNGNSLSDETMARLGKGLELDERDFGKCLADPNTDKALRGDMDEAAALGVSGTPTFVLGRSDGDSVQGARVVGAQPLATFEDRIDALLAASKGTP